MTASGGQLSTGWTIFGFEENEVYPWVSLPRGDRGIVDIYLDQVLVASTPYDATCR